MKAEPNHLRPAISVVVPTFNSEKTLPGCIRSILSQGIESMELIAVDGGSVDSTMAILEGFPAIKIIQCPPQGPYDAMNQGVRAAVGEIIGILNSDDEYRSGTLQRVLKEFVQLGRRGGIVHGWVERLREDGSTRVIRPESGLVRWLGFGLPTVHPATFVSKSVYDRIGLYDIGFRICADQEFAYRAIDRGVPFREVREVLTMMRPGGLSSRCDPRAEMAALGLARNRGTKILASFCWRRVEDVSLFNGAKDLSASYLMRRLIAGKSWTAAKERGRT